MSSGLFGARNPRAGTSLEPARGLFAMLNDGTDVYITVTFPRYRVPRADVIHLRPGAQPITFVARLRDVIAVEQRRLNNVGVR